LQIKSNIRELSTNNSWLLTIKPAPQLASHGRLFTDVDTNRKAFFCFPFKTGQTAKSIAYRLPAVGESICNRWNNSPQLQFTS
jgi:hypothetical protein